MANWKSVWEKGASAGKRALRGGRGLDHVVSTATVGAVAGGAIGGLTGVTSGEGFAGSAFRGALAGGAVGAGIGGVSNFRGVSQATQKSVNNSARAAMRSTRDGGRVVRKYNRNQALSGRNFKIKSRFKRRAQSGFIADF